MIFVVQVVSLTQTIYLKLLEIKDVLLFITSSQFPGKKKIVQVLQFMQKENTEY